MWMTATWIKSGTEYALRICDVENSVFLDWLLAKPYIRPAQSAILAGFLGSPPLSMARNSLDYGTWEPV
jgi:hypothetical protein